MNEQQFNNLIETITGKKIGDGYGFIAGTKSPYDAKGLMSSTRIDGFIIWKDDGESFKGAIINTTTQEESLSQILKFLKA